jgi:hypothetical protein
MDHTNLTRGNRRVQPAVEAPPSEAALWRSILHAITLRHELPHLTREAVWDIARGCCWPHWQGEGAR